jgi:hypothetical protein
MLTAAVRKHNSTNQEAVQANEQKKLKKSLDQTVQQKAFDTLLKQRNSNGGKLKYGAIQKVIDDYKLLGFGHCVTRSTNLDHRFSILAKEGKIALEGELSPPATTVYLRENEIGLSSLTGGQIENVNDTKPSDEADLANVENIAPIQQEVRKPPGRPKEIVTLLMQQRKKQNCIAKCERNHKVIYPMAHWTT